MCIRDREYSASHTEFIKGKEDGKLYFLETSSRVGGANLAEMVEHATGINLWGEWARIESSIRRNEKYVLPKVKNDHAGIIVSLSKFEKPDTTIFDAKEIVWRMDKKYHVGLIIKSKDRQKVLQHLDTYCDMIKNDFHASMPAKEKLVDLED